ncbi:glycosyltransferase family 39 protein [Streptomyces sp. NPDC054887]
MTLNLASRSLPDLWQTLSNIDAVHGLYYLLMHGLFGVFGTDLLVLRLPSVLATAGAAAGVAALGARLSGQRTGLLAGTAFAVLPDVQRYSQEGRSYALVCALVVWATYVLVVAAHRHRRVGLSGFRPAPAGIWTAYGTLMLAACVLHEFAALALVAHAVALPPAARRPWSCTALVVVTCLAPLAVLGMKQSSQVAWIDDVQGSEYWSFALLVAAVLAMSAFASPAHTDGSPRPLVTLRAVALPLVILPTALLMLLSRFKPLYLERYVLYGLVGLALLLGAVLDNALRQGRIVGLTAVTAGVVMIALLAPESVRLRSSESRSDNVTALATALREHSRPGDGVLYLSVKRRAWTLAHPPGDTQLSDLAQALTPVASHSLYGTELPAGRIRERMLASPRVLVVTEPPGSRIASTGTDMMKEKTLAAHFDRCRTVQLNGAQIMIYEHPHTADCGKKDG